MRPSIGGIFLGFFLRSVLLCSQKAFYKKGKKQLAKAKAFYKKGKKKLAKVLPFYKKGKKKLAKVLPEGLSAVTKQNKTKYHISRRCLEKLESFKKTDPLPQ